MIHPQQHVGPIARFRPARAGVNGEKRIRAIVFAGKKLAQLEFFDLVKEARMFRRDLFFRLSALSRVGFFRGELLERFEIFHRAFELPQRVQERAQRVKPPRLRPGRVRDSTKNPRRSCASSSALNWLSSFGTSKKPPQFAHARLESFCVDYRNFGSHGRIYAEFSIARK